MKRSKTFSPSDHSGIRYIITLIVMILILRYKKLKLLGPKKEFRLLFIRGLVGSIALICFYFSIMLLNPSDSVTLVHSSLIITAVCSRIFFKEKLTIAHIIAILLTVNGIIFISKPSFLFPVVKIIVIDQENATLSMPINQTTTSLIDDSFTETIKSLKPLFGVLFAMGSACGTSAVFFTLKKLTSKKVHWASTTIYVCWTGIPFSMILSAFLIFYGHYHKDIKSELNMLPMDLFYSCFGACMSIIGQIFLNIAFRYEEPTKIAITKTVDVFFSCVLQYFLLNVTLDMYGLVGSCSILIGTFLVLLFKLLENKYISYKNAKLIEDEKLLSNGQNVNQTNVDNEKNEKHPTKDNICLKLVFIKF
jgi:drug/metabolite transporter (DMT)-like permease